MTAPVNTYSWLPAVLAEIADVAGLDAALKLAETRGGTKVYIPRRIGDDHWLVAAAGRGAAERIAAAFGGERVMLPLGPLGSLARIRAAVDRMIGEGHSTSEIARAVGYTVRAVERRKAKGRHADPRQGRLL